MTDVPTAVAQPEWIRVSAGVIGSHWLAPCADRRAGCLIVPSLGHEDQSMHRGLVLLARRLAASQHVVMLQHWSTDQSDGSADDAGIFDLWVEGVQAAIDEMLRRRITDITVVGTRLGALIALGVLPRREVRRLVLWSPITSGRRFARELRVMQATGQTAVDAGSDLNVGGYRYPAAMLADLARRQSDSTAAPAPNIVVIDHEARRCDSSLIDRWRGLGSTVEQFDADDIGLWADRSIDDNRLPLKSILLIEHWLDKTAADPAAAQLISNSRPAHASTPSANSFGERQIVIAASQVQVVLAEPEPERDDAAELLPLVLYSTLGPGRSFVDIARREAARGRRSLRVDARGWRWSPPRQRPRTTYQTDSEDHAHLLEAMRLVDPSGTGDKVLAGFCLGGLSVLRLAEEPGVRGVIAINSPLYDLDVDPDLPHPARRPSTSRFVRRARYAWRFVVSAGPVAQHLRRITRGGVRVLLLFDYHDTGHRFWRATLRWWLRGPTRQGLIVVADNEGLGHNLEGADTDEVLTTIASFLDQLDEAAGRRSAREARVPIGV